MIPAHVNDRQGWEERYRSGPRPWDTRVTPPEVCTFWRSGLLPPRGLALDLGCGPGTNAAWLATLGLEVIGVDVSLTALRIARERMTETGSASATDHVHLIQADVCNLPLAGLGAAYILDIGCLHGLPLDSRPAYAAGIKANLAPGGYFHLYAFDRECDAIPQPGGHVRGLTQAELDYLFGPELKVLIVLRGKPDRQPSRWVLLHRTA